MKKLRAGNHIFQDCAKNMIYNFEVYYSNKINLIKAVKIVASYVANFCKFYEAEIIIPKKGFHGPKKKLGKIPLEDKEKFINNIVNWLVNNSEINELFKLLLYNNPKSTHKPRLFDHHDDTCCWVLSLTNDQFFGLQKVLKLNGLPEDLFYESKKLVCIKDKGLIGFLGFQRCYTPKEYEIFLKNKYLQDLTRRSTI